MNKNVLDQLSIFIESIPIRDEVSIRPAVTNIQTIIDEFASIDLDVVFYKEEDNVSVKIRCTYNTKDNEIVTVKIWADDMEVGSKLDEETRDRITQVLAEKL